MRINMSRWVRNLILVCTPIIFGGCAHPLASSFVEPQHIGATYSFADSAAIAPTDKSNQLPAPSSTEQADAPASPKPADKPQVASAQTRPEGLTCQLADSLMQVFKTFTGH
jgi:cell division septation protein DedD